MGSRFRDKCDTAASNWKWNGSVKEIWRDTNRQKLFTCSVQGRRGGKVLKPKIPHAEENEKGRRRNSYLREESASLVRLGKAEKGAIAECK